MRPVALELEGFTCFKERQAVTFDGLDLFAIWGPTGAGKTSLLDGMVFALYGCVPRLGEKRNRDVISLTRDRAVVVFEFDAGGRRYRVVRTVRRAGAGQAKLEDGDGNMLADGVREVDARLRECLGLPYDAFVQAVVLPQGEFARFLKSEPRARREILRGLLRLDVYERMRSRAEERRRDLEGRLLTLTRVLEEYADSTPEQVEELGRRLATAREKWQAAEAAREAAAGRAREVAARHDKTRELLECRKRLAEFDGRAAEIDAAEARLAASQRAAAIMPAIVAADHAREAAEQARQAAAAARAAAVKQSAREAAAAAAVEQAERAAAGVRSLRERIAALQGIRGVVEARALALQRLEAARRDVETARQALGKVRGELNGMDRAVGDLNGRLKDAEQALRGSGYDERLDDLGRRLAPLALRLQTARQRAEEARGEAARAAAEAAEAVAGVERKAAEVQAARRKTREAEARLAEAEAVYQVAHDRHTALVLRRALQPGEACPVCEQVVRALPAAAPAPEVDTLRRALDAARRAEGEARNSEAELQRAAAGLEAMAARAGDNARGAAGRVTDASRAVREAERALIEAGAPAFDREPGATVDARVLGASQRLAAARSVHTTLVERVRRLERDRDVAAEAARGKQAEAQRLQETVERAERQVREITNEVAGLDKQIRAVTDYADPGAEVRELEGRVRDLEDGLQAARAALAEVRAAWAAAQGAADTAETSAEAAAGESRHRLQEAEGTARAAGFAGIEEAKRAAIRDEEFAALRRTVEEHRVGRGAAAERIEALARDLGGREVSAEERHEADRQADAAREAAEAALRAVSTLEVDHARTAERAARRAEHEAEHAAFAAEARIYRELAEELQNNRFQDFVLEEAFHDLTRGASDRLKEVTAGRYSLRYQEGGIVVVDHDNADAVRSADTLSGGETFLASLALALQLSEQIQQAAGAVLLESLFIDEGFGTLDAEALEAAAAAVESLRDNRRMVGIITHIRELADRLPCRIVVERRHEGSRVQVQVA